MSYKIIWDRLVYRLWDRLGDRLSDRVWDRLYYPTLHRVRNRKQEVLHHVK